MEILITKKRLKQIRKEAEQFLHEFDIYGKLSLPVLRNIVAMLGYILFYYNPDFLLADQQRLINSLGIQQNIKTKTAFVYLNNLYKDRYIFIHSGLSEKEMIIHILHEIGHIRLEHLFRDRKNATGTYTLPKDIAEKEAEYFKDCVLRHINITSHSEKIQKKASPILATSTIAIALIIISTISFGFTGWRQYFTLLQTASAEEDESGKVVIRHGDLRYHSLNASDLDNTWRIEANTSEVIKSGYIPCQKCFPQEY